MQALKEFKRFRLGTATLFAAQSRRDPLLGPAADRVVRVLKDDIRRLSERMRSGQFVFENLAKAPWNTTDAFVRSHLMRDGLGRIELQVRGWWVTVVGGVGGVVCCGWCGWVDEQNSHG